MELDFLRARVGDRYIMELLYQKNLILGGETSGHLINLRKTTTGDGIISALEVMQAISRTGKTLHDIKKGVIKYPQKMINVRVTQRVDPLKLNGIPDAIKSAEMELGSRGRVLIRTSGTEPLIRVMVEGEESGQVDRIAGHLATEIETAVAQH
jgi:phosphoglucosamine mutase